jgi:hypothetical protein
MSWGTKIVIVFTMFATGIMYMVIKSGSEKIELVTADYYVKELNYQSKIDATSRAKALVDTLVIAASTKQLNVVLPAFFDGKKTIGEMLLYCSWDAAKDKKQAINQNNRIVTLPTNQQLHGPYKVQLSFVCDGLQYYFEKNVTL